MTRDAQEHCLATLLKLVVFISALKNIIVWNYPLLNTGWYAYHHPIISSLDELPHWLPAFLCFFSISTAVLAIIKSEILPGALIVNGFTNIFLQLNDYLALHHDMLLTGLVFIALGQHLRTARKEWLGILLAIVTSTYLLSGIAKISPDFLSGEITEDIILRSRRFFYGETLAIFVTLAIPLSYFAMFIELIEPICLLFIKSISIRRITILIALPFHFGILLTGTGTVYNLIYPICFWYIIYNSSPKDDENMNFKFWIQWLDSLHLIAMKLLIGFSCFYLSYLAFISYQRLINVLEYVGW